MVVALKAPAPGGEEDSHEFFDGSGDKPGDCSTLNRWGLVERAAYAPGPTAGLRAENAQAAAKRGHTCAEAGVRYAKASAPPRPRRPCARANGDYPGKPSRQKRASGPAGVARAQRPATAALTKATTATAAQFSVEVAAKGDKVEALKRSGSSAFWRWNLQRNPGTP
jgi:hypothetical protein